MGEIVNLRRARKAKLRTSAEVQAAANRAAFGRTKAEKAGEKEDRHRAERILDGVRLEPSS